MAKEIIFEEYDRLYYNYDVCLKIFRDILLSCQAEDYAKIGKTIEEGLKQLKPVPVKDEGTCNKS